MTHNGQARFVRGDASSMRGTRSLHADEYNVVAFQNELEEIKAEVYERPVPPLILQGIVPLDTSGGRGLQRTGFKAGNSSARFKPRGARSNDAPTADISRQKITSPVQGYISAYEFWEDEIIAAQRTGEDLTRSGAIACNRAYNELVESHLLIGDPAVGGDNEGGIFGLFNNPKIRTSTLDNDDALTKSSSAQDLYDTIMDLIDGVEDQSADTYMARACILPSAMLRLIRRKRFSSTSGDDTVLRRIEQDTGFTLIGAPSLNAISTASMGVDNANVGTGASGTAACAIAGVFDPMHIAKRVPLPFLQKAPMQEGMRTRVYCLTDLGGLEVYQPGAFCAVRNLFRNV